MTEPDDDLDLDLDGVFIASVLEGRPIAPRVFNVPGMIPAGTVTTIDGDGGTGKSTLALQLAVATVLGRQWLGMDVLKGRAIYLSAEDDVDELHRRLSDITLHYGARLADLDGLKIMPLSDRSAELVVQPEHGSKLGWTELVDDLGDLNDNWRPVLVVLDSRADVYGGHENDRNQVREFVSFLRRLAGRSGAAFVLLSHPSLSGISSGSGSSGSTAWNNSVRSRLYLSRPAQEGVDPDLRILTTKKANYAAGGVELSIRRGAGVYVADGPAGLEGLDRKAAQHRADDLFLKLLTIYTDQDRRVSDATGAAYAPALFARDPMAGGTPRGALQAAMNRLFHLGLISVETVGPPSKRRRQLVVVGQNAAPADLREAAE